MQYARLPLLLLALLLAGCQADDAEIASFQGIAMTIPYTIHIEGKKDTLRAQEIILNTFSEVDARFNRYNENSELSNLNTLKAYEKAPLSKELEELFILTDKVYALSRTVFDPTVLPLILAWKEALSKGETPTEDEIEALIPAIGWEKIHIEQGIFWKEHEKTQIDLGGIAKGHAVDLISERLQSAGYHHHFVEWGGEIKAMGEHPAGRPWRIAITSPEKRAPLAEISLNNTSIATSGDYEQVWQSGEKTFTHIIDKKTRQPLEVNLQQLRSASVICENNALADALATCCLLFSTDEELFEFTTSVQKELPNVRFILSRSPINSR